MSTFVSDTATVRLPAWVNNLTAFRQWLDSEDVAKEGRYCYLDGEVWIDMSKEQFFSHNQVKQEFARVLGQIAKNDGVGRFIPDGMLVTHVASNLSSQPDGAYVAYDSFRSGRVELVEGGRTGFVELQGSPEMVLEVVSDSSVEKDQVVLFDLYWRAGITEYWLADARDKEPRFCIYRHAPDGYLEAPRAAEWYDSEVFHRSFRLTGSRDVLDHPEFTLETR